MKYWLMKAEPDSRVVKGKDVKFSVDDFEAAKTTPWEGVRNAEARNLMRDMRVGDKVLFYHSNCKNPGVAGFAEVSKEAYPDYTAWDPEHPYFDPKTDKNKPKWYMVEVTFNKRADHFVSLHLLKRIAVSSELPKDVQYIGTDGAEAIKGMALINRGRLSVQPVEEKTWNVILKLAETGGWEDNVANRTNATKGRGKKAETREGGDATTKAARAPSRKRKTPVDEDQGQGNVRRSTRLKK